MSAPGRAGDKTGGKTSEPGKVLPLPVEVWENIIMELPLQDAISVSKVFTVSNCLSSRSLMSIC